MTHFDSHITTVESLKNRMA